MRKEVCMRKLENVFFLLAFVIGAAVFCGSAHVSSFLSSTTLTAKAYGMIVSGGLVVVCAAELVRNFMRAKERVPDQRVGFSQLARMAACAATMIFYCWGITQIGYFTSTTIFLFAMLVTLASRRSWKAVGVYLVSSVAFNILLFYLFRVMKVFMPNTPFL